MKRLVLFFFAMFLFFLLTFFGFVNFERKEYAIEDNNVVEKNIIYRGDKIKDNTDTKEKENLIKYADNGEKITKEFINIGMLEIPKINLKGEIKEGTSNDVIDRYIGHFECTNIWNGNVAICAHNNGYPKNYFAKLNELQMEDIIIYSTDYGIREYIVRDISEIEETDVQVLDKSVENKLTLITCISGKLNKRLCVQAIEERNDIK